MTQHVTIALNDEELASARALAESANVSVEEYLRRLISGHLPAAERPVTGSIEDIFDLVPADAGPATDIALDKDRLLGEAVWREHLRKTGQAE